MKKILRFSLLKSAAIAAILLAIMMATTTQTFAQSPVSGTYSIVDNGQGGWTGGPLNTDGSLGGGGAVSFNNGQVISRIVSGTWQVDPSVSSTVDLCFTLQPIKGTLSGTNCFDQVAADGQPQKITASDGGTTLVRVSLHKSEG